MSTNFDTSLRALVATLALCFAGGGVARAQDAAPDAFELGVDAYRRGQYAEAEAHWHACLARPLADESLARVTYNLGNAAWRQGNAFEAIGWYTATVKRAPRNADAWHNLELARAQAGLEPEDRGDLGATARRLVELLRPVEARRLAAFGLGLLALVCLVEALRGGRFARMALFPAALIFAVTSIPWLWGLARVDRDTLLVIRAPSVALRSEPRLELDATASVDAGEEVERIDALPGWTRVRSADGERGWLPDDAVFDLGLDSARSR